MSSTAARSKLILLILLLVPLLLYSKTDPIMPGVNEPSLGEKDKIESPEVKEPSIKDPQVKDVEFNTNMTIKEVKPRPYKLSVQTYGGKIWKADWHPAVSVLTLTNKQDKKLKIETISLEDIRSITVSHWTPLRTAINTYEFQPDNILIILKDETIRKVKKLDLIHTIPVLQNNRETAIYTIFYDKWIAGEKNVYRWKNSKAGDFSFNFSHALPGVAVVIDFLDMPIKTKAE